MTPLAQSLRLPCRHCSHCVALAGLSAALAAQAESNLSSAPAGTSAGLSASSRLDFRVVIPTVLFMQVGTGSAFADNTTVDRVEFNVPVGDVGTGNATPASAGAGLVPVSARLVTNGNSVSLTARGTAGGLSDGVQSIPWSQIVASASGNLPHPAIGDGVPGGATNLLAAGGVVDRSATWNFSYSNAQTKSAGAYNGRVIYTAVLP